MRAQSQSKMAVPMITRRLRTMKLSVHTLQISYSAATSAPMATTRTRLEVSKARKGTLALIGCGKMGFAMGINFLKAGYPLMVYDKYNNENTRRLEAEVRCLGIHFQRAGVEIDCIAIVRIKYPLIR